MHTLIPFAFLLFMVRFSVLHLCIVMTQIIPSTSIIASAITGQEDLAGDSLSTVIGITVGAILVIISIVCVVLAHKHCKRACNKNGFVIEEYASTAINNTYLALRPPELPPRRRTAAHGQGGQSIYEPLPLSDESDTVEGCRIYDSISSPIIVANQATPMLVHHPRCDVSRHIEHSPNGVQDRIKANLQNEQSPSPDGAYEQQPERNIYESGEGAYDQLPEHNIYECGEGAYEEWLLKK